MSAKHMGKGQLELETPTSSFLSFSIESHIYDIVSMYASRSEVRDN